MRLMFWWALKFRYKSERRKIVIEILRLLCLLFIWIGSLLVSQSKKVINTDMIELCQGNQNLRRDHAFSTFVISIGSLGNVDLLANFRLREVRIFS